jgi:hypothetical protein
MGAGSNKMHRERAAKLALALALWTDGDCGAFGDSGDPMPCSFSARDAKLKARDRRVAVNRILPWRSW